MEPDSIPHVRVETASHSYLINTRSIDHIARVLCAGLGLDDYELSWDFVNSDAMRQLNKEFRNKDRSTDVLSFPQHEWPSPRVFAKPAWPIPPAADEATGPRDLPPSTIGDIVICPEEALRNAQNIGHSLDRETCFLLVHGFLHLCGHDHELADQELHMICQQKLMMDFLEHVADRPLWIDCIKIEA